MAVNRSAQACVMAVVALFLGVAHATSGRSLAQFPPAMAPAPAPAAAPAFYKQPSLPYAFTSLEPYIDARTVQIHWTKHTATYFENLNKAIVPFPELQSSTLMQILMELNTSAIPANISKTVRNNAGGAWNHLSYFKTLQAPTSDTNASSNSVLPSPLAGAIDKAFGNFTAFKAKMTEAGLGVFGSGFAWLTYNTRNGSLAIESTPNQDNPMSSSLGYGGNTPILALDVWEHAYYLKHQNVRANYIKDWFYVVAWPVVNANYQAAVNGDRSSLTSYSTA